MTNHHGFACKGGAWLAVALLTVTMTAGPVLAVDPPPGDNLLGVYTAPDFTGDISNRTEAEVGEQVTVYLVLTGATLPTISGFEGRLDFEGASGLIETTYPVDAVNRRGIVGYDVAYATPLVPEFGVMHLATMTFILWSLEDYIYLRPLAKPTVADELIYRHGELMGQGVTIVPMMQVSGGPDLSVFCVNCAVENPATEPVAWSAVKKCYR